ncbi:phosphoribosylformylglycinamidine synthase [uncultured archaeon]|nr:phosphoribosylformylglycinamidine synthase [uncultured archaeon]HKJ97084.1 phosphoribosylformylglycinamidine synthase subunit PurS [Thermoplasmataceae archaeon]
MSRVRIEIKYLKGVEDPEALTIKKNLSILGFTGVSSINTVRSYEIEFSDDVRDPVAEARKMAEKLLVNPVIHDYEVTLAGE